MSKILLSNIVDINKSTFKINNTHKYIYYLDTANITQNVISNIQKLYPQKDNIPSRAKRAVSNNTIIYSSVRPNLCHFGILSNIPSNMVVSTGFITIDVKNNNIDPYYLFYLITTKEKIDYITNIANTSVSSYPSITPEILGNMEIEIIDNIYEQKRIGTLLKTIDNKIKLNNKINDELEAMAKTIYDYWFLQFEFPNEEGKPYKSSGGKMVWNDELKREIPEGWEVKHIIDILDNVPNSTKINTKEYLNRGKYPIIDQSSKYICGYTNDDNAVLSLKDAIIFGDHTKCIKYINFEFARGADGTQVILSKERNLPNLLLYYQIKDMHLVNQGYSRYFKFLKEQKIIIPDKYTKELFDNIEVLYKKIRKNLFENQELISLRDFLLPLLMNGQVGFKEDKAEV